MVVYLRRCLPRKDTAATWQNLFQQADDASACTNESPEMQEVRHTAGRPSRTDGLRATGPVGLVFTPLNKQVWTACLKNRCRLTTVWDFDTRD